MSWKIKSLIISLVVLVIGTLGFIVKYQYDSIAQLKVIETSVIESKEIGNGIIRAQSTYASKKDLENIIESQKINLDKIQKDLDILGAKVQSINTVKVVSSGYTGTNLSSTETKPREYKPTTNQATDTNLYLTESQWLILTEPFDDGTNVPVGKVGFSAWEKKPWSLEISKRIYSTITVYGIDKNGRNYAYSKVNIDVNGKQYTLPITESKLVEQYPTSSFSLNPRLYLGIDPGLTLKNPLAFEAAPNLSLSIFSYGKTKTSPTWTFANFGLGYAMNNYSPVLIVTPVNYNIAEHLPLVNNLYIGPSISLDTNKVIGLYLGIRVGL
jgi:hypothetical protein